MPKAKQIAVIAGMGEGLGLALAREFAAAGFDVAGIARTDRVAAAAKRIVDETGSSYEHHICDLTSDQAVVKSLSQNAERIGVLVYAAHALLIRPLVETTSEAFENTWRIGCLGAFHAVDAVVPSMLGRGSGVLIFIGATASIRGAAKFAAFASAKFALRGMTQSLARELGPLGVHIAHVIVDGLIDEPQTVQRFGEASSKRIAPEAIAASCLALVRQPPSAWTHELDLRPAAERF